MEEKPEWTLNPDICRCCLSNTGTCDLTKPYDPSGPTKELLYELLQDCFGISLTYLSHEGASQRICEECVGQLRNANHFREQVQAAECKFMKYINKKYSTEEIFLPAVIVKLEPIFHDNNTLECPTSATVKVENCSNGPKNVAVIKNTQSQKTSPILRRELNQKKTAPKPHGTINKEPVTEKKKRVVKNTELNKCMRHNTALILHNSTVMPFRSRRNRNYKYTCFYCEDDFFNIQEIRKHVDEKHATVTEDDIVQILKTPAFTLTKAEFSHFCCKICNQDQKDIDNLIQHLVDVHKKTFHNVDFKPSHGILGYILESENPTCYECHKEFPFFQVLVAHMNSSHISNFDCGKCDKKFILKYKLDQHMTHCHDEQGIPKYKCKFCKESFVKSNTRQKHMKKVHGFGKLKCLECGEEFSEFKQRVRHLVEVHNHRKRFFKCDLCQKQFLTTSDLSDHRRIHSTVSCDICGKDVSSKHNLQAHLRIHTGEKPYACQFCEKMFRTLTELSFHERIHTNDKRYVCEVCNAAFIQIHSLRKHYTSRHPDYGVDLKSIRAKKSK